MINRKYYDYCLDCYKIPVGLKYTGSNIWLIANTMTLVSIIIKLNTYPTSGLHGQNTVICFGFLEMDQFKVLECDYGIERWIIIIPSSEGTHGDDILDLNLSLQVRIVYPF